MQDVIVIDNWTSLKAEALENGYISTQQLIEKTGVTMRRLNYWEAQGVFGKPLPCGSGKRRFWHESLVEPIRLLAELSNGLGSNSHVSLSLMQRIYDSFGQGHINFTENTILKWKD